MPIKPISTRLAANIGDDPDATTAASTSKESSKDQNISVKEIKKINASHAPFSASNLSNKINKSSDSTNKYANQEYAKMLTYQVGVKLVDQLRANGYVLHQKLGSANALDELSYAIAAQLPQEGTGGQVSDELVVKVRASLLGSDKSVNVDRIKPKDMMTQMLEAATEISGKSVTIKFVEPDMEHLEVDQEAEKILLENIPKLEEAKIKLKESLKNQQFPVGYSDQNSRHVPTEKTMVVAKNQLKQMNNNYLGRINRNIQNASEKLLNVNEIVNDISKQEIKTLPDSKEMLVITVLKVGKQYFGISEKESPNTTVKK